MNETYLLEGELAFVSYMPLELEIGMHFLSKITVGVIEPISLFFTLEHIPEEPELFMSLYGAPVKMVITIPGDDEEILAESEEIGWFDECSECDEGELVPLSDVHINIIINEYDGRVDLMCDEDGDIATTDGKVIISFVEIEEEEEL
jgi:hypothetical protein